MRLLGAAVPTHAQPYWIIYVHIIECERCAAVPMANDQTKKEIKEYIPNFNYHYKVIRSKIHSGRASVCIDVCIVYINYFIIYSFSRWFSLYHIGTSYIYSYIYKCAHRAERKRGKGEKNVKLKIIGFFSGWFFAVSTAFSLGVCYIFTCARDLMMMQAHYL